jgi:hypothetical protein
LETELASAVPSFDLLFESAAEQIALAVAKHHRL